jgi:hypothetical protein
MRKLGILLAAAAVTVAGAMHLAPTSAAGPQTVSISVQVSGTAASPVDSGFTLIPGVPVQVSASGTVEVCQYDLSECASGPNGTPNFGSLGPDAVLNGANAGVLLGFAGTAAPLALGGGPTQVTGSGHLAFQVNDYHWGISDNAGAYTVTITYTCYPGNGYDDPSHYHCGAPGQSQ